MRKVIVLLVSIFVIVACCVPVFAAGNGNGMRVFTALPLDYIFTQNPNGADGPFEWPMRDSKIGSVVQGSYNIWEKISGSTTSRDSFEWQQECTSGSLSCDMTVPWVVTVGTTQRFTLQMFDELIEPMELTDYKLQVSSKEVIVGFEVSVEALYPASDSNDNPRFDSQTANVYIDVEASQVNLGDCIIGVLDDLDKAWNASCMYIKKMEINMDIRRLADSGSSADLYFYELISQDNYTRVFMDTWFNVMVGHKFPDPPTPPPTEAKFDVGLWLADNVGAFLDFEIFPGFSFNSLFYAILVVGFILWFLKVVS